MSALRKGWTEIVEFPTRPTLKLVVGGATPPSGGGPTWQEPLRPGQIVAKRFLHEEEVDPKTSCCFYKEMESLGISKEKTAGYLQGTTYTTPQLARALGVALPMSPMFFINLQTQYDTHMMPGVPTPLNPNPEKLDPK